MAGVPAGLPAGVRVSDHISLGVIAKTFPPGHRQLGCRPACEMRLSRVGGRDDDIYLSELCRLPLPG